MLLLQLAINRITNSLKTIEKIPEARKIKANLDKSNKFVKMFF